jgi:uncharacterized protein (DUF433 family)/predicted nuclease of predicted toxin-antitoxin system
MRAMGCFDGIAASPADGTLKSEDSMLPVSSRITIEPRKWGGKPCVRGLRITVWDVLGWLGAGMTQEEILDEHPDLEKADFTAVYHYAAEVGRKAKLGWSCFLMRTCRRAWCNGCSLCFPTWRMSVTLDWRAAGDRSIWHWAKANGFAVITTASDFIALSRRLGWPPKIIHLEQCDFPLGVIEEQLRRSAVRISEFGKDENAGVLASALPGNPTRGR